MVGVRLTEAFALNLGLLLALQILDHAPEATQHVNPHSSRCHPPEKRVAHKAHVVVGLSATVSSMASSKDAIRPWQPWQIHWNDRRH